jgi:hypothetical protein
MWCVFVTVTLHRSLVPRELLGERSELRRRWDLGQDAD